ncbi:MAG: FGGY-family carbohydrate kinase, partial [Acidobacteriota bacterium]
VARATVDSMAYQSADVVAAMEADAGVRLKELRVDGGASLNNDLLQFQADLVGRTVRRPKVNETTALGAAYLAGLATGFWKNAQDVTKNWALSREFKPALKPKQRAALRDGWQKAVERSKGWVSEG